MTIKFTLATAVAAVGFSFLSLPVAAQDVTTIKLSEAIHADGMVMNAEGDLLVSSAWEGKTIAKVKLPSGEVSTFAAGLKGPISVAMDKTGTLFSTNWQGQTISKIGKDGTAVDWVNIGPKGDGLAFDSKGDLWVTAGSSNEVRKISPDGTVTKVAKGGMLKYPLGIAISEADDVFVGGGQTGEIYKITPAGEVSLFAQVPGPGPWRVGHLLYANGRLFASGLNSNKIFEISAAGAVTTLAGSGAAGHADGDHLEATFNFPVSLHLSADKKHLFVFSAGAASDRLRKVEL